MSNSIGSAFAAILLVANLFAGVFCVGHGIYELTQGKLLGLLDVVIGFVPFANIAYAIGLIGSI